MRFGRTRGRFFDTRDEEQRIDRALAQYQQVYGTEVLWYFLRAPDDPINIASSGTVVHDVYDEGLVTGGKSYDGPHRMPVMSAQALQGQDVEHDDQGMATWDHVTLKLSYEQARKVGIDLDLVENREAHIHDRFVWRKRLFDVEAIQTSGHFDQSARDMTILVQGVQLRSDEFIDSPQFENLEVPTANPDDEVVFDGGSA